MEQSPQQGTNRTGIAVAARLGEEMITATREFPPSSPGSALAIAEVRIAYAREGEPLGETAPPSGLMDKAKAVVTAATGGQPTLLMDKLGERLAFERTGARLYETLLSKHQAYGAFSGGPSAGDVLHILHEEYAHADLLERAIKDLGGDPTAVTPSANLAANVSAGLPQVLADPRTNLLQSLEAIVVAELADNECWTALAQLAEQAGEDELVQRCQEAIAHERDHLRKVRAWVAAGQGRTAGDDEGAEMPEAAEADEFTFAEDSSVDREGYVVSEEERAETRETGTRQARKSGRGRQVRRDRS
jgi:rubrerythrin